MIVITNETNILVGLIVRNQDNRLSSTDRGYDALWRKVRNRKLKANPLCENCQSVGILKPADIVHHIVPVETDKTIRLVPENLMSLCRDCHEEIHGRLNDAGCDVDGMPLSANHRWNMER